MRSIHLRRHEPRKAIVLLLLGCALLLYLLRFADVTVGSEPTGLRNDAYDTHIASIHTLDGLEYAARAQMADTGNPARDLSSALARVVELHTVHGTSRQGWRENWIANSLDLLGLPRMSFAGKMRPEDLAEDNIALCSQAALLLKELFRRNGIEYATVVFNVGGVPPHSAVAAKPDGVWRYYDPSWEPVEQGVPFDSILAPGTFSRLYAGKGVSGQLEDLARRGKIAIDDIDGAGPTRGIALQKVTAALSLYGWLLPLLLALRLSVGFPAPDRRKTGYRRGWKAVLST